MIIHLGLNGKIIFINANLPIAGDLNIKIIGPIFIRLCD